MTEPLSSVKATPMKFETFLLQKEGFDAGYKIVFENGLELLTHNVVWKSVEDREKIKQQFLEFVEYLGKKEVG